MLTLLSIAFFTAIAVLGYRLYRQFSFELDSLTDRQRLVLYGAVGGAFLTFCATSRLFDTGGAGVFAWLALLACARTACTGCGPSTASTGSAPRPGPECGLPSSYRLSARTARCVGSVHVRRRR